MVEEVQPMKDYPSPRPRSLGQQPAETTPLELQHLQLAEDDVGTLLQSKELGTKPTTHVEEP